VRGGTVVAPGGARVADVGVTDGLVAEVGDGLDGARVVDATGLHVLPGALDPHVHFNEPGREHWEGLATGTAALAAGGVTGFFDMPLNSSPPLLDAAAFDAKLAAAQVSARVDFGFWGGLVPGNRGRLAELAARGVVGFKAFMCDSGIAEFPAADDATLREGMARCAELGRIVAVHAEDPASLSAPAGPGAREFMASRPVEAEVGAIGKALRFAEETGCALHVVHVSSGRSAALVSEARARGVDVTCETCPHYLLLSPEEVERLGPVAKCAPPVRAAVDREDLWTHLRTGTIDMVVSDHSPSSPDRKAGDFASAWGGVAGCQTTLALMLGALAVDDVARLLCRTPADRFGIRGKGRLEPGADADLVLVDLGARDVLAATDLRYRHRISPWVGRRLGARVVRVLLRGEEPGGGRLLSPAD